MQRNNILVRFKEKDEVKKLGGRWDPCVKTWYYLGKRNRIFYKWESIEGKNEIYRTEVYTKMLIIGENIIKDVYFIIYKYFMYICFPQLFFLSLGFRQNKRLAFTKELDFTAKAKRRGFL
jgi:Domain of unknown function (DUF5710)